jgi:hypothetical protein
MSDIKPQKDEKKKESLSKGAQKKTTKGGTKKTVSRSSKSETKKTSPPAEKKDSFLIEAAENIEAGAEIVGEKVSDIAEKTAEAAGEAFEVVKNKLSIAYDSGTKVVDDITKTTQQYIEKFEHNKEIKNLTTERDKLTTQLGMKTFIKYKTSEASMKSLLHEKEIVEAIKEIEKLNKKILKIGKKLEKRK